MTGMEKGDILLYRFTRYSGQPRRRPGGRALPALWQAGGIHLPERGTGNFLEDEKVASPHLDSRFRGNDDREASNESSNF